MEATIKTVRETNEQKERYIDELTATGLSLQSELENTQNELAQTTQKFNVLTAEHRALEQEHGLMAGNPSSIADSSTDILFKTLGASVKCFMAINEEIQKRQQQPAANPESAPSCSANVCGLCRDKTVDMMLTCGHQYCSTCVSQLPKSNDQLSALEIFRPGSKMIKKCPYCTKRAVAVPLVV